MSTTLSPLPFSPAREPPRCRKGPWYGSVGLVAAAFLSARFGPPAPLPAPQPVGVAVPAGSKAQQVLGAKLRLSAPLTHSDWMLREGAVWGPAGLRRMLDTCKASGWSRVYWRALDGGRSLYRSRLLDPQGKWE
jgi:hypothetical protein